MAYTHVAHDCQVGNDCVLANAATLGGHVEIGDHVILGGLSAVHQFTRVGQHAFVAGGSMVVMDVPPFCTAQGDRAELVGINSVGPGPPRLHEEQISRVKEAYRILFRSKLPARRGPGAAAAPSSAATPRSTTLISFVAGSKRGVTR